MTPVRVGEELPADLLACALWSTDGSTTSVRELVRSEPTLFVFVRQFACAGCSERLGELLVHLEVLQTAGVNVVVVGCGSVAQAAALGERLALASRPITLVTDPTLAIHRAAGLARSYWGVLGVKATLNFLRAVTKGHRNGWGGGDFYQLGGTILLDHRARVVLVHAERHLGETFSIGDVVDKALTLLVHRAPEGSTITP